MGLSQSLTVDHSHFRPHFLPYSFVFLGEIEEWEGGYSMPCLGVTGCESSIVPDPYLATRGKQRGSVGVTDLGVVCKRLALIRDYRWVKSHRYDTICLT